MLTLPPDVTLETYADEAIIYLPRRPTSPARFIGCAPILFGLVFAGFAIIWMILATGLLEHLTPLAPADPIPLEAPAPPTHPAPAPPPAHHFDFTRLLFAAFGLPFFFFGLVPIFGGLMLILPNRETIRISSDLLTLIKHAGPLRRTRKIPLNLIQKLRISRDYPGLQAVKDKSSLASLVVEATGKSDLHLAAGYPRDLILPLAEYLTQELKRRNLTNLQAPTEDPLPTPDATPTAPATSDLPAEEAPPQPPGSKIVFLAAPESLTFIIPRTGFKGVALFFLMFSIIWDSIVFIVVGGFLIAFFQHPSVEDFLVLAFLSIFVIIGVAMALAAIQTAFRRAVILATKTSLIYTQKGPIRNVEHQWTREELAAIKVDYSGTTINNRRLNELQIHNAAGVKRGFFDGREEPELQWIAATLRSFLQLPPSSPP